MSRFQEELRIVPGIAWAIAALFFVCAELLLWQLGFRSDPNMRNWPFSAEVAFSTVVASVFGAYVLLVGYISRDAKRRGMRQALWTFIAIMVPNFIGIILYFVLREPLLACCPKCGTSTRTTFAFCHQCGTEIHPACPNCRRPVDNSWNVCAYCGTGLTGRSGTMPSGNPASNPNPVC